LEALEIFASIWREADVWQRLMHPSLVRLLGVLPVSSEETVGLQFVSELLHPCTPLHSFLYPQRPPIASDLRIKIAVDVARGLEYMHSLKPPVLHRDLKSPNILVFCFCNVCFIYLLIFEMWQVVSENARAAVSAKIIDFGTSFQGFCSSDRVVDNPTW
jgi:serine/threonine protein kinase